MKGFLFFIFASFVLGVYALPHQINRNQPIRGRVSNGEVADRAPHACIVLVHRPSLSGSGMVVLGGGSIISRRHVVTAAHLVIGNGNTFQIGFIVGTSRRLINSSFALIHESYNSTTYSHDIALIFAQGTATFPTANIIAITPVETAPGTGTNCALVGYGFTEPNSNSAATNPYAAVQAVANVCAFDDFETADTHFCAIDEPGVTVVCAGDNGAGLYVAGDDVSQNTLVGIASRILLGCSEPQLTGYTIVGRIAPWILNIIGQA